MFPPFGTFKCILVRCIFNHCTCAFAETIISKVKASLEVGPAEWWHKIDVLTHVNLLSKGINPFYHLDTDEIPRIFRWGKFRMQWRNDFYLSHVKISTWRLSWPLHSQPIRNYLLINYYNYSFIYFQTSASKNALCQTPTAKNRKSSWKFNPPRPSLFYLRSKNYILMAVSHSFKIFQRTTRKCIFHTLCDITFTVEISEKKKNCLQDKFISFSMLING